MEPLKEKSPANPLVIKKFYISGERKGITHTHQYEVLLDNSFKYSWIIAAIKIAYIISLKSLEASMRR